MNIEQAKEELKTRCLTMSQCFDREELHKANKAIDIAIQSIEMWDKFSDEIEDLFDKKYNEIEDKVQDNLAEGFLQCEKLVKRKIREIKEEIEE